MQKDYSGLQSTAKRLLAKYGTLMGLERVTGAFVDPVTGVVTGGTTDVLPATGVFLEMTQKDIMRVTGMERLDGREKSVMLDSDQKPEATDVLLEGSDRYEIAEIQEIRPATTTLAYQLVVRHVGSGA